MQSNKVYDNFTHKGDEVILTEVKGKGGYGIVYEGTFKKQKYAIKEFNLSNETIIDDEEFFLDVVKKEF